MTHDEMLLYKWQDAQEMRPAKFSTNNGSQSAQFFGKLVKKVLESFLL